MYLYILLHSIDSFINWVLSLTLYVERYTLYPSYFPKRLIYNLHRIVSLASPFAIHIEQHLAPIHTLHSSSSSLYFHDTPSAVVTRSIVFCSGTVVVVGHIDQQFELFGERLGFIDDVACFGKIFVRFALR